MFDHTPLIIDSFRGTYDRGEEEVVPAGFFMNSLNLRFSNRGFATRYGTTESITLPNIRRIAVYKRIGEAQRLIILVAGGLLYDSTNLASPILAIAAMTDFSMITMFGRAYITPHNGLVGLPGEKVYVYTGVGTALPAAGAPPTYGSPMTPMNSALSGNVEAGTHAYGVAFESASGYITAPGGYQQLASPGAHAVDIYNIPLGPAGTVARVLVATKILVTFNGNWNELRYYFIPNGRIPNNTETSKSVSFYDADLMSEATYLVEQLATIPAGVGISLYRGHMITWGEDVNQAIVRVSKSGEPESFNAVEGFITVNPGDSGGGIQNACEYRSMLFMFKSQRTYATLDNNQEAAFWEVNSVDMSIGTECHGLGKSLDFGENVQDQIFVADRSGLRLFGGTFNENTVITENFDDVWHRITPAHFHKVEVAIDPINQLIYVAAPLDGATDPSHIIYGDYSDGLGSEFIRWTLWTFQWGAPQTVVVDVEDATPVPKFGCFTGNVYKLDPTTKYDDNLAIPQVAEFPFFPTGNSDDMVNHFTGIRLRIRGEGALKITIRGLDSTYVVQAQGLVLSPAPGKPLTRGFNFVNERCSVKFELVQPGEWMHMTKFGLYVTGLWEQRPEIP
jgi:hypothetical protein